MKSSAFSGTFPAPLLGVWGCQRQRNQLTGKTSSSHLGLGLSQCGVLPYHPLQSLSCKVVSDTQVQSRVSCWLRIWGWAGGGRGGRQPLGEASVRKKVSRAWVFSLSPLPSARHPVSVYSAPMCVTPACLGNLSVSPQSLLQSVSAAISLTSQFFLSTIQLVWLVPDLWGEKGRSKSKTAFWDKWKGTVKVFPIRRVDLLVVKRICFFAL